MMGQLANHLWQTTIFGICVGLLAFMYRANRAQVRYWLWFAASVKFLIPFAVLINFGALLSSSQSIESVTPHAALRAVSSAAIGISEPFVFATVSPATSRQILTNCLLIVAIIWGIGLCLVVALRFRLWRQVRSAMRTSNPCKLSAIRVPSNVEVRTSAGVFEPGIVGWRRPVLLLPSGIADRVTSSQMEAIIAHELCHVRRQDNLTSAIHMMIEAAFWFHPLVWWIGARMMEERERACDEEVLRLGNDPQAYAEGILNVCKMYVESPVRCVSGITGADLKRRFHLILSGNIVNELSAVKRAVLAIASLATLVVPASVGAIGAPILHPQSDTTSKAKFEVASIKPASAQAFMSVRPFPGRLSATASLQVLIQQAYSVHAYQIVGGPDWTKSERFQIEANVEGNPSRQQIFRMLQSLLEDRYQLKIHRETRDMPVYALVAAKGGLKLQMANEDRCSAATPEAIGDFLGGRMPPPQDGPPPLLACGAVGLRLEPKGAVMHGGKIPMSEFVRMLSLAMGRGVIDETGFTGLFDLELRFLPDENTGAMPPPPPDVAASLASQSPSILVALQEQLGLKLETARGPVEVIVIDRVEKPTPN